MAIKIVGNTSGNTAEVDANNNLKANLPTVVSQTGYMVEVGEISPSSDNGGQLRLAVEPSLDYRKRVAIDQLMFNLTFESATASSYRSLLQENATTMASTITNGAYVLNSGNSTTSGHHLNITTYATVPLFGAFPTYAEFWARTINGVTANAVTEMGIGYVATTAVPTDGAFFRWNAVGELRAVINYAGTELQSLSIPWVGDNINCHFVITWHEGQVLFWINEEMVARIVTPNTQPTPTASSAQKLFARVYNSGTPSLARRLEIGQMSASLGDQNAQRSWPSAMVGMGNHSGQIPAGTAAAGRTANWANSAAPANITLANAGPGNTSLGGQWGFAAVGSAETDFVLFGYQVPAGTAAVQGRKLFVTDIRISAVNTVVAVATTATVMQFGIGYGGTSTDLNVSETAAVKQARRLTLGLMTWPIGAAVGAMPQHGDIVQAFNTPVMVEPGNFFHVIVKVLLGTATATEVFRGTVLVNGYFE